MKSVWPAVSVDGVLERARAEWLHTNGAGAYASSTVAQMHTRRYHGLLVAALDPPRRRHVMLSHLDVSLEEGAQKWELGTHQFPNVLPTKGYQHLSRYDQDPVPRWSYQFEGGNLEQTLAFVRGQNALVLKFVWSGPGTAMLRIRPLLALRPFHHLVREHGSMHQSVELRQGEVRVRPLASLPRVVFSHAGTFIGSPDWWHRFEYLAEQGRGLDFQEDLWTPGVFSLEIGPEKPAYLVVALDHLPERSPEDLLQETRDALNASDPGPNQSLVVRRLATSADAFCADLAQRPAVIAGYHWFEMWGRDALISLPGLYLARGKIDAAREILRNLVGASSGGLVPHRLPDDGHPAEYHAADATLWLFEAARLFARESGWDDPFVQKELYRALVHAFEAVCNGTRHNIHCTAEGLYAEGEAGYALTWMDARVGDWVVTPRAGLAVELQALWVRACLTLAEFAARMGDLTLQAKAIEVAAGARHSFRDRFWCSRTGYPFDVMSESAALGAWQDACIRPNAVIALAVEPSLFSDEQASSILAVAERDLLTPVGLRTLSPRSPGYTDRYGGSVRERDAAYHQGTVWPFLLGFYARALLRHRPGRPELRARVVALIESTLENYLALGHLPEVADAEHPHRPGGCIAQAWSTAELLRVVTWDLEGKW